MPPESRYPNPSARLFAAIADWCIVLIIASALTAVFGRPVMDYGSYIWIPVWLIPVAWLYFAGYESGRLGATPMKKFLLVRVASMQGGRLVFWRATIRQLGKLLPLLVVILAVRSRILTGFPLDRNLLKGLAAFVALYGLLELILMLRKGGRTLHDLMAGSIVIRTLGSL